MSLKIPRLLRSRCGVYYWRCLTPQGKQHKRSLHTKDPKTARTLALKLNLYVELFGSNMDDILKNLLNPYKVDLARGVFESSDPEDHKRLLELLSTVKKSSARAGMLSASPQTAKTAEKTVKKTMRFFIASQKYLDERKVDNAPKTVLEKKSVFAEFHDHIGDLWLNAYDKRALVKWKDYEDGKVFTARRRNKRLGFLSDLFRWAINHGHYEGVNPCEGLRISSNARLRAKAESYEPFTEQELSRIFGEGYKAFMFQPNYYWIPLLGLYTGARIEELARLKAEHVMDVDGTLCLHITQGKNSQAKRFVPIHSALFENGFVAYAQAIQASGETMLFPELKDGKNGFSKNASRRFAEWLDVLGIVSPLKVFHSFRHTVITRLHALRANAAHAMQITGHKDDTKHVHFSTYTHAISPKDLKVTVELLDFKL